MAMKRSSGILMPIFSLPSNYGIGTIGKCAYDFIDFLYESNQKYWQVLPVGPISYGNSPYQSFSTFAGNPYFIDLDLLIEEGMLTFDDVCKIDWGSDKETIDYGKIYEHRYDVLKIAYKNGLKSYRNEFETFKEENDKWLKEYALFMACKRHFDMKAWMDWPDELLRLHDDETCNIYREKLHHDVELFEFIQYLFYKQWDIMMRYAHSKGIEIIGDVPIYVALDSSDVWSEPQWFDLDKDNKPVALSGCPPDAFSATGQLWGNPLYRYDRMKEDGYGWWIRRIEGALKLFDVIRIDHFRGFEAYWSVPYPAENAIHGQWIKGPGMDLIGILNTWFDHPQYIAEDLGTLTPEVIQLVKDSGLPGMKILEFAFDTREPGNYMPYTYTENSICYIGTHDNAVLKQWKEELPKEDLQYAMDYLGIKNEDELVWGMVCVGMSSVSRLFIAQMQDYLELGAFSRINTPSTADGNWMWRMKENAIHPELINKIAHLTELYGRAFHK